MQRANTVPEPRPDNRIRAVNHGPTAARRPSAQPHSKRISGHRAPASRNSAIRIMSPDAEPVASVPVACPIDGHATANHGHPRRSVTP